MSLERDVRAVELREQRKQASKDRAIRRKAQAEHEASVKKFQRQLISHFKRLLASNITRDDEGKTVTFVYLGVKPQGAQYELFFIDYWEPATDSEGYPKNNGQGYQIEQWILRKCDNDARRRICGINAVNNDWYPELLQALFELDTGKALR